MKNEKVKKLFASIDTDRSMDQRITDHLLNYQEITDNKHNKTLSQLINCIFFYHQTLHRFTRLAAAIILITIFGTTTVLAANYLIRSYTADLEIIPEVELGQPQESTVNQRFGTGHKNESRIVRDAEGNILEAHIPEDPNNEDVKYGDEVFSQLGLPNLIPTFLYDNYLLGEGGYLYTEYSHDDNRSAMISAYFFSVGNDKQIYLYFHPSKTSTKDNTMTYMTNEFKEEDLITSTYVTEGGLTCNLVENEKHGIIDATIIYDSEQLGNATYFLDFVSIPMEEVKTILDSIPISAGEK